MPNHLNPIPLDGTFKSKKLSPDSVFVGASNELMWAGVRSQCHRLPLHGPGRLDRARLRLQPFLPQQQTGDDGQVRQIEGEAHCKCRRIETEVVIEQARKPAAGGHAGHPCQYQRRYAPAGLMRRKKLPGGQHVRRDQAAETKPEGRGHGQQPYLVLGSDETSDSSRLSERADQHGRQTTNAI